MRPGCYQSHAALSTLAPQTGPAHISLMTIRKIARMGHPVLGQRAEEITDLSDPELRRLVEDMVMTMIDANGAGLAAPQVHESIRLVIFQAPISRAAPGLSEAEAYDHTASLTVLINPEIEVLSDDKEGGWEGCLSVPGLRGWVERAAHIRYRGLGLDGKPIERVAKGFHARVVQHECDHLDGILYPQRMTDMTKLIFESETKPWLEQNA
jgi:peptide deformylase